MKKLRNNLECLKGILLTNHEIMIILNTSRNECILLERTIKRSRITSGFELVNEVLPLFIHSNDSYFLPYYLKVIPSLGRLS